MSHVNNDLERAMSNITIGSLQSFINQEDFKSIFALLTQSRSDQIKDHVKEILSAWTTDESLTKFIGALFDILKSDINCWVNIEKIKTIFNEIDMHFSNNQCDKSSNKLNIIIENVYTKYLSEVENQIQKFVSNTQDVNLYNLSVTLLNFTQLLDLNNYEPILYPMVKFAESMFVHYNQAVQMQPLIVEFIFRINHRLVNYLAVVPGNPVSKGLKESIYIYSTVRNNIVTLIYTDPDIITRALSILEHRSRFFGLTADAIPENENHGDYIVVDPLNTAFEDDEVYDDYENFLADMAKD